MSVESLAVVLHHSRAKGTPKLLLLGVANHEGDGGAWPTLATLARYANVDVRTAQRGLAKLQQLGELGVELQGGGLAGVADCDRPNLYHVQVRCPTWCDGTTQHRDQRRLTGRQVRWSPQPVDIGVTQVSPPGTGVTPGGDVGVTPPGGMGVTQTTHDNHPQNTRVAAMVTTGDSITAQLQAQAAQLPPCSVCGKQADRCMATPEWISGHAYSSRPIPRERPRGWTHRDDDA